MSFEDQQDETIPSESSAEATEQQPTSGEGAAAETTPAAASAPSEDNVPFHKHPRFQELIQERNTFKEQIEAQAKVLQSLQDQVKKATPAERDELMERLAGIDPQFGALVKNMRDELKTARQQIDDFNQWRQTSSAQTAQQQVASTKTNFYTENKVPEERRGLYEAMIKQVADSNPKLNISDLP